MQLWNIPHTAAAAVARCDSPSDYATPLYATQLRVENNEFKGIRVKVYVQVMGSMAEYVPNIAGSA